ncbi:MAG: hypothetical protein K0S74_1865 [Chlamydiales bacterium]|nr:hypothetical protein [Chlamydiales bacterium]
MKHGKRPRVKQKIFIEGHKLDPDNWLVVKDTTEFMEVVNRKSRRRKILDKI